MYLYDTIKGANAVEFCQTVLKMEPADWDLDAVNRVEIFGTSLTDEGQDYCEYRVFDCQNKLMVSRRELGY